MFAKSVRNRKRADLIRPIRPPSYMRWAIHNEANWQDDGAKKDTMGLGKSMNGADLPVFLL